MPALEHRKRLAASARRQQILEAATTLFISQGFEAVGMADIAAALGVSRPAVYSYFASTETILGTLLSERLGQLWSDLERLIPARAASDPRPPQGLYAALFRFLIGERESLLLLHSGGGPAFQARRTAFLAELGGRLEAQYPDIRRRPYQITLMTHLLDGVAYLAVQQDLGQDEVHALTRTLDSFMRGGVAELTREAQAGPQAGHQTAPQLPRHDPA